LTSDRGPAKILSAANRRNPSTPPRAVGWGEATTDEMCIGFISYIRSGELHPERMLGVATGDGLTVTEVMEDLPAKAAGILPGDKILKMNGRSVRTLEDLVEQIQRAFAESEIVLLRGDKEVLLGDTVKVMSIIKRAGAVEIAIAAETERKSR